MRTLLDEGSRLAIEVDDVLDEEPEGGWGRVSEVWHVGETLPEKAILARVPQITLLSSWYSGDDDRAEHAAKVVVLAERLPKLTSLCLDVDADDPARFAPVLTGVSALPGLQTLGLRVAFLKAAQLEGWLALPAVVKAPQVRLAVRQGLAGMTPLLLALNDAARGRDELEISFDFGWEGWLLRARRDERGRFGEVALEARPLTDRAFGKTKVVDVVAWLDGLPSDALSSLSIDLFGVRATKADVAAIAACLARHTALSTYRLGDQTLAVSGGEAAATPTTAERESAEAATGVEALQARAQALGIVFDKGIDDPLGPLAEAFSALTKKKAAVPPPALSELALLVLELPKASEAVVIAALALLERAPVAGTGKRLVAVLDREESVRLRIVQHEGVPLRWVLPAELPALLDWYETRPDNGLPMGTRKLSTNEWFHNLVFACGDGATTEELQRRLAEHPLTKWKRDVYEGLRKRLARRPKPKS